jgi:hypothetical protein
MVMMMALVGGVAHADSYHWSIQDAVEAQQRQIQQQIDQQMVYHNQMVQQIQQQVQRQIEYSQRSIHYSSYETRTNNVVNPHALDEGEQVYVPPKTSTADNVRLTQEQQQLTQMGIPIISGVRSQQQQEALKDHQDANGQWYTAQGRPVANRSAHRTGDAIDTGPLNAEQRRRLASAGWFQPIPQQDPGHWEKINPSTSVASR